MEPNKVPPATEKEKVMAFDCLFFSLEASLSRLTAIKNQLINA